MKRLTEKEIQEKLYGKYHRGSVPAAAKPEVKPEAKPEPTVEAKPEIQQELPLGLKKEEKPTQPKRKPPAPRKKTPFPPKSTQPLAPNQARLFVVSLFVIGLILLLFSLKSKPGSSKTVSVQPTPSKSTMQTISPNVSEPRRFTLQTIIYAKRDQAEHFVEDLKKMNLQALIEEEISDKGQPRYLVLVGDFPTAGEAAKSLETLTRNYPELFRGSFVRKR